MCIQFIDYECLNCFLNFLLLITNSISMVITCYNLQNVESSMEFIIILSSLGLSMLCLAIKQSMKLESIIKVEKIKNLIKKRDNIDELIEELF